LFRKNKHFLENSFSLSGRFTVSRTLAKYRSEHPAPPSSSHISLSLAYDRIARDTEATVLC
jgi:hypothetical protein